MLLVCYLLVFALLTTHLSPATAGIGTASCLDCPLEDGDSRAKLSFNPIIPSDEDFLKAIALASSPGLLGGAHGAGGGGGQGTQQKAKFYRAPTAIREQQQQQHHQKILAQQQQLRDVPSTSSSSAVAAPPSNLLHVYTLLNKGSVQEPRLLIDEYYLQDPRAALLASPRFAKKAERGMLVDVMDYVSKPDDRNRRVGQNMRSSG